MKEVVDRNFKHIYPEVVDAIKNASFIGIDSEFTGIRADDSLKESLFDSVEDRYDKLCKNIQPFVILQYGITTFQADPGKNTYKVKCFTFYLLPRSVLFRDRQFSLQVSALEFLSTYNFDFNKFAYDGISYLNEKDEALFKAQLETNELTRNIDRYVSYKDEDDLKDYKNKVAEWLINNPQETSFHIETGTPILQYLMHKELRSRFSNIWTISGDRSIIVMRVPTNMRKALETEDGNILENALLDSCIGFSKVFKLLVSSKKPIVGHNILMDLLFMHQQFYRPLPRRYSAFKASMHELFPSIYDTKFLSFELRELLTKEEKWKSNSLGGMYEYFNDGLGKHLTFNSAKVDLATKDGIETGNCEKLVHNAGWDSYAAGYIFIKMAYIFAEKKYGKGLVERTPVHTELMSSLENYVNCINIIRGSTSHLKLDGPDPTSTRPKWLYVKPLQSQTLNISHVAEKFSAFGTVDVMPFARHRVLVAVANHGSARDILQFFRHNKELYVVPYNPFRHSTSNRFILWGSVILSGGMFVWMFHRTFPKPL